MTDDEHGLQQQIRACRLCAGRFAATATAHRPAPVVWFAAGARILIAAQAPGIRAHHAARPFADRSGERLRDWLGLDEARFYDRARVAILPASFCFPGYNAQGHDLPPPPVCAATWAARARAEVGPVRLRVLVGGYAHRLHLGLRGPVAGNVRDWRAHAPGTFVLPHPSWRNNAWLAANPWFADEVLPALRGAVAAALA
jgi:uracil-DNA glycosylase